MHVSRTLKIVGIGAILVILGVIAVWYFLYSAPQERVINEPRFGPQGGTVVVFDERTSLYDFAYRLEQYGVVRSASVFLSVIQKFGLEKKMRQGTYVFTENAHVFHIAKRVSTGAYGYTPIKVTIPEGFTTFAIASSVPQKLVDITADEFIEASQGMEGYLFPDTYFLYPYATSSELIHLMRKNFDRKIKQLSTEIASSGKSIADIITMASIIEKEVQTPEDKALVSGLFWNRIARGMPLQADSTLTYVTGRGSDTLLISDLRQDSEFNSYTRKGLPPTPISNPGMVSIRAALAPATSTYLFFLSDMKGKTHFSNTYAEHLRLKQKYLPW
jgi:UPF0755 protein